VPAASQTTYALEVLVTRLHESHEVSVYDAMERLVEAGQAVGFDPEDLLRMLDRGMTFEELLELIESKMESGLVVEFAERDIDDFPPATRAALLFSDVARGFLSLNTCAIIVRLRRRMVKAAPGIQPKPRRYLQA